MTYTATYSPEDNKLRLYSPQRLEADLYKRVRAAGFIFAPKQDLFVAPMWTPERADLLEELAGEIGDEDTSLVERAEVRAERFEEYSEKRADDAERARVGVAAIAENIPFGQPILVGHHSERRARKDAQRIGDGMRRAVGLWETSEYWERRAAGALAHAKYKELPAVRARRIKKIEAALRKEERNKADYTLRLTFWSREGITKEKAADFLNCYDHGGLTLPDGSSTWSGWSALVDDKVTVEYVAERRRESLPLHIAHSDRWIAHYNNRLAYERAMLNEQGASHLLDKKKRPAPLPLCNYVAAEGLQIPNRYQQGKIDHYPQVVMTKEEYARINGDYKSTRIVGGSHRVRVAMIRSSDARLNDPKGLGAHGLKLVCVFLSDSKTHEPPAFVGHVEPIPHEFVPHPTYQAPEKSPEAAKFEALRDTLRAGVEVVVAPQLFTTRADIAAQAVDLLELKQGQRLLEPNAGTAALLKALPGVLPFPAANRQTFVHVVAVEYNRGLADGLMKSGLASNVYCADFLSWEPEGVEKFDRVLMNPPFENGADIKHIMRALGWLKPGGRLVAICANGPRQQEKLRPLASHWEELPADAFAHAGTNVRAAMLVINA
ncbi:MAG: DUF3560 domain-containing protein [Halothiobacillaceae bacterium]|nr:DUF3560 domain-containing protein [Halothiobacillaceae bacterium]